MRNSKATVCEDFKGNITILYKGKKMNYTTYRRAEKQSDPESSKTINNRVAEAIKFQNKRSTYKPGVDKQWRKSYGNQVSI